MDLSEELLALPTPEKLKWLQSSDGLLQLRLWLLNGLSLHNIALLLLMPSSTFYDLCDRCPELAEITGRTLYSRTQTNLSLPPAYRVIAGITPTSHTRGTILSEYETANDLWESPFIQNYFASFSKDACDFYGSYLQKLNSFGIFQLSNTYSIAYCKISQRGIIKILKSTS